MRIIFLQLSHTFWDLICCIQDDQSRCIFLGQEKVTETISSILFPLLSWSHASITRNTRGIFEMEAKKNKLCTFFKEPTPLSNFCDETLLRKYTAQKLKFSIKNFISKCDQIRGKLRIWSHLLKKSIMENFIFCAVIVNYFKTPTLESRLYCWCLWCFIKCFQRKLILIRLNKSTILRYPGLIHATVSKV